MSVLPFVFVMLQKPSFFFFIHRWFIEATFSEVSRLDSENQKQKPEPEPEPEFTDPHTRQTFRSNLLLFCIPSEPVALWPHLRQRVHWKHLPSLSPPVTFWLLLVWRTETTPLGFSGHGAVPETWPAAYILVTGSPLGSSDRQLVGRLLHTKYPLAFPAFKCLSRCPFIPIVLEVSNIPSVVGKLWHLNIFILYYTTENQLD